MTLTPKQKAFCDCYLKTGNAVEAYKKAGYKDFKSASVQASKTLKNPKIKAYIEERTKAIDDKRIADITEVMKFYSGVMRGEVKDQFELDAALADRLNAGKELMKRYQYTEKAKSELEIKLLEARIEHLRAQTEKIKEDDVGEDEGVAIINDVQKGS